MDITERNQRDAFAAKAFSDIYYRYKIVSFKKFYLKFKELTILQTLSEEFKKQKQQTLSAESSLLHQKGQALPDLFKSHFPYNYPFIY